MKVRSDSKLKTLPEERQAQIAEMLRASSLEEVKAQLAQDGLDTSVASLSEFYSWYHMRRQYQQTEDTVQAMLDILKQEKPEISDQQIFNYGQQVFSVLALKEGDNENWARIQRLHLRSQHERLLERRVRLLEKQAEQNDRAKTTLVDADLTPEQRDRKLKEIFGIS